ncbi:MAG TPA: hypothetical protein IAA17_08315 [Candidatus Lachnoclostridium stercorigallinarum]|uniref:FMN-binding domain-containing protein n=1 Tax=Candidatus Lachnoclostridium stercorigallinarum TaxID=2838634 RepID=A0A9D2GHE6_9FIRM|nr:hypothetical protein [Candidatus Lachnoclostridium stercorigallinarum]
MKKWRFMIAAAGCTAVLLTGCGSGATSGLRETEPPVEVTAASEEAETEAAEAAAESADLSDLTAMVGMRDEDTADLLGGGEENWTADRSFYIGRLYEAEFYGIPCEVSTTCGDDGTVESVSLRIVGGERQVTEEEVNEWEARVTELMGTEPSMDGQVSEGGSTNRRWTADGMAATMYQMADQLSISFQPAVGELH